jgi:hypothetical protein
LNKEAKEEYERAVAEFLANGGEIQQIPIGKSSPDVGQSAWGRPQAKPKELSDINLDEL